MRKLEGRVAIVTGGAGGIGREIAFSMAAAGARIIVADIDEEGAVRIAEQIGSNAEAVRFDLCEAESIEALVRSSLHRHGRIDILVNNGADTSLTYTDGAILDTDIAVFDRSISANLRSLFISTKAALPALIAARGAIVNIASIGGMVGDSWLTAYAAAKAGVISLTRNTAVQYGKQGVRCNAISPGFIAHGKAREMMADTLASALEVSFVTRNGEPQDVASLATFLASDDAGFINGANVVCDGGWTVGIAPWRKGNPQ